MRKGLWILLAVLCIGLTGCGGDAGTKDTGAGNSGAGTGSEAGTKEVYSFEYKGAKVTPNDLANKAVEALGKDYTYYESPSCAYVGLDKCYVYNGFSLYTYPDDNGTDYVLRLVLMDDSVSTPEGLSIGDAEEKVTSLYGKGETGADGAYAYTKGDSRLEIIAKDGKVNSIQYCYTEGR